MIYGADRLKSRSADGFAQTLLPRTLHHRAVGGGCCPCAGIIAPGIGADDRARAVLAADLGIVGEPVVSYGRVRAEGRDVHDWLLLFCGSWMNRACLPVHGREIQLALCSRQSCVNADSSSGLFAITAVKQSLRI
jgi:hypothetical protein